MLCFIDYEFIGKTKVKEVSSILDFFSIALGLIAGLVVAVISSLIFFRKGVEHRKRVAESEFESAEKESQRIISEAEKVAERKKRDALMEAREEIHKSRVELEREVRERRSEIQRTERRLQQKDETLEKKMDALEKKEEALNRQIQEIEARQAEIEELYKKQLEKLESISGLSVEEAKQYLLSNIEGEVKHEAAIMVKEIYERAKEEANRKAKEVLSTAIQRCAADHASEITVSVVPLPNDEMKGRIIGREGRNIRTLETLTGIDLIIDDTPEAVVLSGFDPIRREVARITLEKLIIDGRIHPARIEEMVEKAKKEVENTIREEGDRATFETGVHGLNPEIIKLLGKLKYRTSYGQNVLSHSIEVSHLAGLMAAELGEDVTLAKRAGLLHDIGKAIDHEVEGTHVSIGAEICRKYKESEEVIHAVMAHHGDIEANSIIAVLVQAADAVSGARPGARRETLETYVKRLQKLEEIADSLPEVEKSYAIQAGREIRIMVKPEMVSDDDMIMVARDIVKRIENEMEYPGQIKVHIIRETRAVEYAK
ncbi:MAG: ribonuclease Y [Clostridiaceae bacterium]|nr:ribonuclease Y [Clostridiaceae bacterium]